MLNQIIWCFEKLITNTQFDQSIITFRIQNGRPLEIEDKVNLTLLITKYKLCVILQNQKQGNMLKDINFYHFLENIKNNYWILD